MECHISGQESKQDLFNICEKILNEINKLNERINIMDNKINIIDNKINNKSIKNDTILIEDLRELKKEDLIINEKDILHALQYRDYRSILKIFKIYYKNKLNNNFPYPIKIVGKSSCEYYCNNKWNSDSYCYHAREVIFYNIQNLFIKYNILDKICTEEFLLNQDFIIKLSNEKYQKSIFKNILEEIRITS